MAKVNNFEIGDTVTLNTDEFPMNIKSVNGDNYLCAWRDDHKVPHEIEYPSQMLRMYEEPIVDVFVSP